MNKFFTFLAVLAVNSLLIVFLFENDSATAAMSIPGTMKNIDVSCFVIALVAYAAAMISAFCLNHVNLSDKNEKLSSYKEAYDKKSVDEYEKSDKIIALENKIKTLETALKKALNN